MKGLARLGNDSEIKLSKSFDEEVRGRQDQKYGAETIGQILQPAAPRYPQKIMNKLDIDGGTEDKYHVS
jgi:hypothetical protein